ncbi:MAG: DUF6152 family protein [Acidobacteria bacterium]|nr:DUF6152 family protein [Acidobacteriota bacterium]
MTMTRRRRPVVVAMSLLAMSAGLSAHHSFTASFDARTPVVITGVVTHVVWANPHVMFSIAETDTGGAVTTWRLELGAPSVLLQRGWRRASLTPGDTLTVHGVRARDGTYFARVVSIRLKTGQALFANDATNRESPR